MRGLLLGVVVVGVFIGLFWAAEYRQRASQAEVTRAAYAQFGPGPRIICVAQDGNGDRWNCRSFRRWGDDPNCRQASVSFLGTIHISRHTVVCEG
jgi:hypothetical protein